MRVRRRRRRARAAWEWAYQNQLGNTDGPTPNIVGGWILPPERCRFLMESRKTDRLVSKGILCWLDFWWQTFPNGAGSSPNLPDVYMWIAKVASSDTGGPSKTEFGNPFSVPVLPSAITTWDGGVQESDGTDPYMWCHFIKGMTPCNSKVQVYALGDFHFIGNQVTQMGQAAADGGSMFVCRKHHVTQEWQPDVVVKTARRISKGEGIAFFTQTMGTNTGVQANVSAAVRVAL